MSEVAKSTEAGIVACRGVPARCKLCLVVVSRNEIVAICSVRAARRCGRKFSREIPDTARDTLSAYAPPYGLGPATVAVLHVEKDGTRHDEAILGGNADNPRPVHKRAVELLAGATGRCGRRSRALRRPARPYVAGDGCTQ